MRYKVFVDTNSLLSGIFFEGNESRILDLLPLLVDEQIIKNVFKSVPCRSVAP